MTFKRTLTQLVAILEPFARMLQCLESTYSTVADVYLFWLAAMASLKQHLESKNGLSASVKRRVIKIVNKRYNEMINTAPTDAYITGFFLDPSKSFMRTVYR